MRTPEEALTRRRPGGTLTARTRPTALGRAGIATVAALALALGLALDAPAVRMAAALVVCLVLPGLGWARRLRLKDLGDTIALTVVLSLSITAVVATAMALTGAWSPVAGLVILVAITGLGFVPVRAVVVRAGVVVLGRADRHEDRPPVVEVGDVGDGWTDWYADARARSDEERRRREAEAEAAEQDWRDWYAESRRATARERHVQWERCRRATTGTQRLHPASPGKELPNRATPGTGATRRARGRPGPTPTAAALRTRRTWSPRRPPGPEPCVTVTPTGAERARHAARGPGRGRFSAGPGR